MQTKEGAGALFSMAAVNDRINSAIEPRQHQPDGFLLARMGVVVPAHQ